MPKPMPIRYALSIQNPFNMNETDDYESDQPFQPFRVGDMIDRRTFEIGNPGKVPAGMPEPVVGVIRGLVEVNGVLYDSTHVVTDIEWWRRHTPDERDAVEHE